MRYTITTTTYKCPLCGRVVKKKTDDESLGCLLVLFLPIWLTYILIKWVVKRQSENYTISGEQIKTCGSCGSKVVIGSFGTHLLRPEEMRSTYRNTNSTRTSTSTEPKPSSDPSLQTKITEKGTQIALTGYGYDKSNPINLAGVHNEYRYLPSLACTLQGFSVSNYDRDGSISAGNKMLDLWTIFLSKSGSSVKYYVEIYIDAYAMFNDTSTAPKGFSIGGATTVDDDDEIDTSSNRKY